MAIQSDRRKDYNINGTTINMDVCRELLQDIKTIRKYNLTPNAWEWDNIAAAIMLLWEKLESE